MGSFTVFAAKFDVRLVRDYHLNTTKREVWLAVNTGRLELTVALDKANNNGVFIILVI